MRTTTINPSEITAVAPATNPRPLKATCAKPRQRVEYHRRHNRISKGLRDDNDI
jgi:hypothetical protein